MFNQDEYRGPREERSHSACVLFTLFAGALISPLMFLWLVSIFGMPSTLINAVVTVFGTTVFSLIFGVLACFRVAR